MDTSLRPLLRRLSRHWEEMGETWTMKRPISLRIQLLVLQLVIVLITVLGSGIVAGWLQERQVRDAYRDRMIAVAQSVAALPAIIDAFGDDDPSRTIQPIAETVRKASDLTYVVVANGDGIRYSHPDPSKIGRRVSTDPSVPLSGQRYVGTQTGTLGTSWRVKVPIFDEHRSVLGEVSVGILESKLEGDFFGQAVPLFVTFGVATILGVLGAAWISAMIRRRTYGLDSREIAGLLEEREAMLHGVREGIVAIDGDGGISLINDAAAELLGLGAGDAIVGAPAREVFDDEVMRLLQEDDADQRLLLSGERVLLARRDLAVVDGRQIGTILILRDNTELHTLLRDLDGAHGLAEGLRSQAHGFANKLHVISGLLELGHIHEAIKFIERDGNGGTLSNVTESTRIRDLEIAALLLVKHARAQELGVAIAIEPTSTLPDLSENAAFETLRSDLIIVVGNLLDNAIEACPHNGRITISFDFPQRVDGSKEITVVVSDNGTGIPPELRERIFLSGYSTRSAIPGRVSTGRGIGLAQVRRIVQRRHGSVVVRDHEGGGTVIEIVLPAPMDAVVADESRGVR